MTPEEVREQLAGTVFGPVRFVSSTGSTNADLMASARGGAPEGAVIVADHQTAGRGRRGRSWVAPPGAALLASVLLRPRLPGGDALLSPATALAVRDACAAEGADVRLKWPNDVIVAEPAEAKLAGVLAELHVAPDGTTAVVSGFGVNLRPTGMLASAVAATAAGERESGFAPLPPCCLEEVTARPVDRNELLVSVLGHLDAWYRRLHDAGGDRDLVDELRRRSATLGREVRVMTPGGTVAGRAENLTADGKLVVMTAGGPVDVAAGDCQHLRVGAH